MKVVSSPVAEDTLKKQEEMQTSLIECLSGKKAIRVELNSPQEILKLMEKCCLKESVHLTMPAFLKLDF